MSTSSHLRAKMCSWFFPRGIPHEQWIGLASIRAPFQGICSATAKILSVLKERCNHNSGPQYKLKLHLRQLMHLLQVCVWRELTWFNTMETQSENIKWMRNVKIQHDDVAPKFTYNVNERIFSVLKNSPNRFAPDTLVLTEVCHHTYTISSH